MKQLSHVDHTKPIRAADYNALVDAVNYLLGMKVGPGLSVTSMNGGIMLGLNRNARSASASGITDVKYDLDTHRLTYTKNGVETLITTAEEHT